MKFKSDIEVQAGLKDGGNDIGTAGQLLSSTGTVTNWIDQADVVAAGATRVLIACKNTSGGTITKGTPVYQTGNVGATDVIEVAEADALISTGYLPAIGLLETDLINNAFGHVVITGELLNITTSPIDGVVPVTGDTVYLKSGGGLTLAKPTGEGNAIQNLGLVGKVSGGNAGSLTVASIMRQNDVPNLPEGRIWIGDGNTIVSDTVYVDEPNNRVGIGTTTPSTDLEVSSTGVNGVDISQSASNASQSGRLFFTTNTASEGFALFNSNGTFQVNSGGIPNNTSGTNRISIIGSSGNVGIGTTSPNSKLQVDGEIDANGGDGYRINGKPWADEYSNDLRLGDWDGEGFSTSIFDDNSNPTVIVKDYGTMINCSSLTSSYGATASLAVGTGAGADAAVLTLSNSDTNGTAGESTGIIQFAIKDDQGNGLGYTSASIQGSISQAAGQGNGGGGILDFYTAPYGTGNSPQLRMRINDSGDVGIGTTSPGSILHLEDITPTLKILSNQYYGNSAINMGNGVSEAASITCANNPALSFLELRYDNGSTGDSAIRVGQRNLDFMIDAVSAMYINSSKNVGIGTTSPGAYKLAVDGSTAIGENLQVSDGLGGDRTLDIDATVGAFQIGDIDGITDAAHIEGDGEYIKIFNGGSLTLITDSGQNVGIGNANPQSRLQVNGGVQLSNDTASPSAFKVGTFRYRTSGNNSYVDMCMQTGASTYAWVNIVTNSW